MVRDLKRVKMNAKRPFKTTSMRYSISRTLTNKKQNNLFFNGLVRNTQKSNSER